MTLSPGGCAGFAFGGSEADEVYTALCLDAGRNLLHYEGYETTELSDYEPTAYTRFDFSSGGTHHVKLICENEIVVMYVNNLKALSTFRERSTYRCFRGRMQCLLQQHHDEGAGLSSFIFEIQ